MGYLLLFHCPEGLGGAADHFSVCRSNCPQPNTIGRLLLTMTCLAWSWISPAKMVLSLKITRTLSRDYLSPSILIPRSLMVLLPHPTKLTYVPPGFITTPFKVRGPRPALILTRIFHRPIL